MTLTASHTEVPNPSGILLRTGELLVREGLIHPDNVNQALTLQKKHPEAPGMGRRRLFGMILCDLNLITAVDNYRVLHRHRKVLTLSSALKARGLLSGDQVTRLEETSRRLERPLLSVLAESRPIPIRTLQALVFDLFHIPFRSISDFAFNETDRDLLAGVVPPDQALARQALPLVIQGNTLVCAITDPDGLLFIHELNERFPQYRFKPLFIPYSGFSWFYGIIYGKQGGPAAITRKPPDLSLLLNFRIRIQDPKTQKERIDSLYDRYEQIRMLMGHPGRASLKEEFFGFVAHCHQTLIRHFGTDAVVYSLKKNDTDVQVTAFPAH